MNKHICVLFCFNNIQHIKQCYESLYNDNIDYFVVENKSTNSQQIQEYFNKQNLKGYIQFEQNITYKAMEIFLQDYKTLLEQYDYITITDCDITTNNSKDTFEEILKNLNLPNVGISAVDFTLENLPNVPGAGKWVPNPFNVNEEYIECPTGLHLVSVKKENLNIIYDTPKLVDTQILKMCYIKNKKWVKTLLNKAYHLTWDLYTEDNDYYQFKLKNNQNLWNHNILTPYKKIK